MRNRFNNFYKKASKILKNSVDLVSKSSDKKTDSDSNDTTANDTEELKVAVLELNSLTDSDNISDIKKSILTNIYESGIQYCLQGYTDGTKKIKTAAIAKRAHHEISSRRAFIESTFKGKRDKKKIESAKQEEIVTANKKELHQIDTHLSAMNKEYRWDFKNFSLLLGLFYLITAVFLLISDVPLSMMLASEAFQLKSYGKSGVSFIEGWEGLAISIGVALCSVYIKIYYDEYIGFSRNRLAYIFHNSDSQNNSNLFDIEKRIWWVRFFVKTGILSFSIYSIVIFGLARFQAFYRQAKVEYGEQNFELSNHEQTAFVVIGIIFPIISGICLSLGLGKIQNYGTRKRMNKKLKEHQNFYEKSIEIKSNIEQELADLTSMLDWCKSDGSFVSDYSNLLIAYYSWGYEHGLSKVYDISDIYAKAKELRTNHLAAQASNLRRNIGSDQVYNDLLKALPTNQN